MAAAPAVPVLMYHRIDRVLSAHDPITVGLTVMAPAFEAQLQFLRQHGFRSVTLDDMWTGVIRHASASAREIVLTFDDGYEDNYAVAFPLLRRYGFTGTFFVVTSTVGTSDHLTVAQIKEMAAAGMAFGSHGQHHVDFSALPPSIARSELENSKRLIGGWVGDPVTFFAYPSGRYSESVERNLSDLGYRGAVTEIPGFVNATSRPYELERVRVAHDDSLAEYAHKLRLPAP
jgi:peptidoglycan/xylan/chitin deacetylase (PgdA/CDA1 family)